MDEHLREKPSLQAPETTQNGATLYLCPPLGLFTLARYQSPGRCEKAPIRGFFQLQMLSDSKAAVLIRLSLMEGLEKESSLEQCTLTIPFPGRLALCFLTQIWFASSFKSEKTAC